MNVAVPRTKTSWAASSRPPIAPASAGADKSFRLADACRMGGRVKPGHDEIANDFNYIKNSLQIVFPLKNLYLYWSNELWHADTPSLSRHCGCALARAENAVRGRDSKKFFKTDEQFCCRSSSRAELRQPQRRRRRAGEPQCHAARPALGRTSRPSRRGAIDDPLCKRALRQGESAAQSAPGAST